MPSNRSKPQPRWSKKTDQVVRYVALRCRPGFQSELGHWIESSPRFGTLITSNQDKVRKKLNASDDENSRLDVRAELLVVYLMLGDRRFEVSWETYGARRLGPDLTLTFRANQRFNLEVTRLRATDHTGSAAGEPVSGAPVVSSTDPGPAIARLAHVITGKLRQLPGDLPNGLLIAVRGLRLNEDMLAAAVRLLKLHADRKDEAFLARGGFKDARGLYAQYVHLSGIFVLDEATAPARAIFSPNPETRHPLAREVVTAAMQCLTAAGGTRR
jgi:hypothetical protein